MLNRFILSLLLLATCLLLAEAFTPLSISGIRFNSWLVITCLVSGVVYAGRAVLRWGYGASALTAILATVLLSFANYALVWGGDWKTQTVIYQYRHAANRTIEFQMMNPGPGAYRQRTVDKTTLLPGIYWLKEVKVINAAFHVVAVDTLDWKRVNVEKNGLGIKYE